MRALADSADTRRGSLTPDEAPVKVYLRVRASPSSPSSTPCVKLTVDETCCVECDGRTFFFSKGGDESASQQDVFACVGLPTVEALLSGTNSTIMCYGQTGAGKTWTMLGSIDEDCVDDAEAHGLCPRVLQALFEEMERAEAKAADEGWKLSHRCYCSCKQTGSKPYPNLEPSSCVHHCADWPTA